MEEEKFLDQLSDYVVQELIKFYGKGNWLDGLEKLVNVNKEGYGIIGEEINEKFAKQFNLLKTIIEHKLWLEQIMSEKENYRNIFSFLNDYMRKRLKKPVFISDFYIKQTKDDIDEIGIGYNFMNLNNLHNKFENKYIILKGQEKTLFLREIKLKNLIKDHCIDLKMFLKNEY